MGRLALCQGLCECWSHRTTDTGTMIMPFPDATSDGGHRSGQGTSCSPAKLRVKPRHQSHFLSRKLQCTSVWPLLPKCCARCPGERGGTPGTAQRGWGRATGRWDTPVTLHACASAACLPQVCIASVVIKISQEQHKLVSNRPPQSPLVWPCLLPPPQAPEGLRARSQACPSTPLPSPRAPPLLPKPSRGLPGWSRP